MKSDYPELYKLGATASLCKLILIILFSISSAIWGSRAQSALEAFASFQESAFIGLMKDEILLPFMMSMYFLSFAALFILLYKQRFTMVFISVLFTYIAVILTLATHSGFSLMHLSELYYKTEDPNTKNMLLAAGEAVLSKNMWNSTASYFSGILMQGGGVLISIAMVGSGKFNRFTIISGILSNGLDLIQHIIHHTWPAPAEIILRIAGPFYIIWFIMLAIDLFKNAKRTKIEQ